MKVPNVVYIRSNAAYDIYIVYRIGYVYYLRNTGITEADIAEEYGMPLYSCHDYDYNSYW